LLQDLLTLPKLRVNLKWDWKENHWLFRSSIRIIYKSMIKSTRLGWIIKLIRWRLEVNISKSKFHNLNLLQLMADNMLCLICLQKMEKLMKIWKLRQRTNHNTISTFWNSFHIPSLISLIKLKEAAIHILLLTIKKKHPMI